MQTTVHIFVQFVDTPGLKSLHTTTLGALRLASARPVVRSLATMTRYVPMLIYGDYGYLKECFGGAKLKRRRVVETLKGNFRLSKKALISEHNAAYVDRASGVITPPTTPHKPTPFPTNN